MDDNWENAESVAALLTKKIVQDEEDVKDSWEDADEEETAPPPPPPAQPQTSKAPTKKLASKITTKAKTKTDESASSNFEERQLTAQEVEELKRKSDLEHLSDTFGVTVEQKETLRNFEPSTKEDFKAYCQFLITEINKHKKKKEYYDFLSEMFRSLSLDLDSEHVRRYSKELAVLATEMQKREKENEKQKQPKSSKKPAIVVGKRGVLDDFVGEEGYYGGGGGDDDEDFM